MKSEHPSRARIRPARRPRAFTITELLVAVAVLIAVIVATGTIFTTASRVTGVGQAGAAVLQEAAVIEARMREDIRNLSRDGFFAIRQVAVPNNVHGPGQPLLNPALPEDAWIRADQLVFLTDQHATQQTFRSGQGSNVKGQGTASRVYYGHAFQLPNAAPYEPASGGQSGVAADPAGIVFPWSRGDVPMVETLFAEVSAAPGGGDGTTIFGRSAAGTIDGTQPEARRWLFSRQAVPLLDDDRSAPNSNAKTVFMSQNLVARSIFDDRPFGSDTAHEVFGWSRELRNGRIDAAASGLEEIRRYIRTEGGLSNLDPRPWRRVGSFGTPSSRGQRELISEQAVFYPRAERTAPSSLRVDEALTNHAIGSAVSSVRIEWTYADGVGEVRDADGGFVELASGEPLIGFRRDCYDPFGFNDLPCVEIASGLTDPENRSSEQPWFGLPIDERPGVWNGAGFYGIEHPSDGGGQLLLPGGESFYRDLANYFIPATIDPQNVERVGFLTDLYPGLTESFVNQPIVYEAIFGFNQSRPLRFLVASDLNNPTLVSQKFPDTTLGYTPWPTAIRVTLTLHDPRTKLEYGRKVQFVIDLPRRPRG